MALAVETNAEIDAFYERVARRALHPLWLNPNVDAPRSDVRPWLWPWQTLRPSMLEAAEFMPLGVDGGSSGVSDFPCKVQLGRSSAKDDNRRNFADHIDDFVGEDFVDAIADITEPGDEIGSEGA